MYSVKEYIVDNVPSAKYVRLAYLKENIFIDTRDEWILSALRVSHMDSDGPMSRTKRLKAIKDRDLAIGSYLFCGHDEYGLGRVVRFFETDDSLMLVLFDERSLPIMCGRKTMTLLFRT